MVFHRCWLSADAVAGVLADASVGSDSLPKTGILPYFDGNLFASVLKFNLFTRNQKQKGT